MTWLEYVCFIPPLKEKGKCEECWCRDEAKCERNGFRWAERVAEMRERERRRRQGRKIKRRRCKCNVSNKISCLV